MKWDCVIEDIEGSNETVKRLVKLWKRFKGMLIPEKSPLMRFVSHRKQQDMNEKNLDLELWQHHG